MPAEVGQQTLENVQSFDLAWTFMGHSYAYILFIGISQLVGAWCLLWNRTKLVGIAILIPILVNIIVFDAIFFDTYGALASASIYLALLLLLLFLNKEQVTQLLKELTKSKPQLQSSTKEKSIRIGIALLLVGCIFGIEQLIVNLLGH